MWATKALRDIVRRALIAPVNVLARPLADMASDVEQLDASAKCHRRMRKFVIHMRCPTRLLLGWLRPVDSRRAYLEDEILKLPISRSLVYLLHYYDRRGRRRSLLTMNPKRGLRPLPRPSVGPCPIKIISAYHMGKDVTDLISPIAATFHPDEKRIGGHELYTYMRYRIGFDNVRSHPIFVMDSRLQETEYTCES